MVMYDLKRFSLSDEHWTFAEWLTAWKAASDSYTAMGLLHAIFQVKCENQVQEDERIVFLLQLADGWQNWSSIGDNSFNRSGQALSMRAFRLLGNGFFSPKAYRNGLRGDRIDFQSEFLTEALFHFFRPSDNGFDWLHNLSGTSLLHGDEWTHARAMAEDYLEEFTLRFSWHRRNTADPIRYKPNVIAIWAATKQLNRLLDQTHSGLESWNRAFDPRTLEQLEQRALKYHQTLKDAVIDGEQAAQLLQVARAAGVKMPRKKQAA